MQKDKEFKNGDPYGTRTRVARMKTWSPRPLDEGVISSSTKKNIIKERLHLNKEFILFYINSLLLSTRVAFSNRTPGCHITCAEIILVEPDLA